MKRIREAKTNLSQLFCCDKKTNYTNNEISIKNAKLHWVNLKVVALATESIKTTVKKGGKQFIKRPTMKRLQKACKSGKESQKYRCVSCSITIKLQKIGRIQCGQGKTKIKYLHIGKWSKISRLFLVRFVSTQQELFLKH